MNQVGDDGIEEIAREWCRLGGLDPDAIVFSGSQRAPYRPYMLQWQVAATLVRERLRMDEAIAVLAR